MHNPTPAERKAILARLPKPPEGKVWKQLTKGNMTTACRVIGSLAGGVFYDAGQIHRGAPFDNAPVSAMLDFQSAWRLVAARKRPAKPAYRYAYSEKGKFIEKFSEDTYQVFNHDSVCPEQKRVDLYSMILSSIGRGIFKEITRDQFLAKIKEWGFNEDGTKIVPPKTKLDLAREEIVTLKARVATLESKIASAQGALS